MNEESGGSIGLMEKIPTGINGLDHIALGGIPKGRATLVSGSSGSCKTVLGLEFIRNGIELYDDAGVFVTFEEPPEDIRRNIFTFNFDIARYEALNKFAFVDVSPDPIGRNTESGAYDFSALMARIEHAVEKVGAGRVVIDSVGALFSQFSDTSKVRKELFRVASGLKLLDVTTLITAERTEEYGEIARFQVEEFVADNVIILRHVLENERRRRTVEILKFRGAKHQNGEYPFTISDKGIEVIPLSAITLEMLSTDKRISSGNKELDQMCGGGFFRDSILLANGATGTGKTLMATTFISEGCRQGKRGLILAFEESRSQMGRNAKGWGIDFYSSEDKGLLKIICAYPESASLADHLLKLQEAIEVFKPERIAVDSLSALERVSTGKDYREFVISLTSFIKDRQIAGLFTSTATTLLGGESITDHHISTITDSIILLRYVELMGEMRRGITVLKMRGSVHEKTFREYTIDNRGMHIGDPFRNVSGILSGAPQQLLATEQDKIERMFE